MRSLKYLLIGCTLIAAFIPGLIAEPAAAPNDSLRTATFSMYCYWTGEATLGRVDGVAASRIGHWAGREIVQVDFDPRKTDLPTLVDALKRKKSFYSVVVDDKGAAPSTVPEKEVLRASGKPHFIEPKHSLRTRYPQLAALDLTEAQAIALNSWSYFGGPMPDVLTEKQMDRLKQASDQ